MSQKGFSLIFVILGLVVVITIAGGTYYLGRSTSPKPSPNSVVTSQTPQSTSSPSPSDTSREPTGPAEIANWKTYTNSQYGFSIQHPSDLVVSEQGAIRLTNETSMPKVIPDKYINILIFVRTSDPQINLREWIEKDTTRNKPDGTMGSVVVGAIEDYQSGDLKGFIYHGGAEVDIKHVLFQKEDQIFDFTLNCYETGCSYKDNPTAESTFNQILSTFKFLP